MRKIPLYITNVRYPGTSEDGKNCVIVTAEYHDEHYLKFHHKSFKFYNVGLDEVKLLIPQYIEIE